MVPENQESPGGRGEIQDSDQGRSAEAVEGGIESSLALDFSRLFEGGEGGDHQDPEKPAEGAPVGVGEVVLGDPPERFEGEDGPEVHADDATDERGPAAQASRRPAAPETMATKAEIAHALKITEGNFIAAAAILGITTTRLRLRVSGDPQLRAVWTRKADPKPPSADAVLTDTELPIAIDKDPLIDTIRASNRQLRNGLGELGISNETIRKLEVFDRLGANAGMFLVSSLDLTHKTMVFQNTALFEQAEFIRENYLNNVVVPAAEKIEWQRMYNEISDILGKNYERTLAGTQAMAKMMRKDDGKAEKTKPGFKPLRKANAG